MPYLILVLMLGLSLQIVFFVCSLVCFLPTDKGFCNILSKAGCVVLGKGWIFHGSVYVYVNLARIRMCIMLSVYICQRLPVPHCPCSCPAPDLDSLSTSPQRQPLSGSSFSCNPLLGIVTPCCREALSTFHKRLSFPCQRHVGTLFGSLLCEPGRLPECGIHSS